MALMQPCPALREGAVAKSCSPEGGGLLLVMQPRLCLHVNI